MSANEYTAPRSGAGAWRRVTQSNLEFRRRYAAPCSFFDIAPPRLKSGATDPAALRAASGPSRQHVSWTLRRQLDFVTFFAKSPRLNPARSSIKGLICGVRIEDIEEPTMREIRYLDKLIDELAKGKAMEKILRK